MDNPSAASALAFFIPSIILSGILSGMRLVLGFYQKQNLDMALSRGSARFQRWIEGAASQWNRPGFFESMSAGRFTLDCIAVFSGSLSLVRLSPLGWGPAFAMSALIVFCVAHWAIPLAARTYAPNLGGPAIWFCRAYNFAFMGWLGRGIHQVNTFALSHLGRGLRPGPGEAGAHPQEGEQADRRLKEEEKEMIRSIFDLRETQAKEVMTPRVDVVALELHTSHAEVMNLISHEKFSRIPVYDENIDHIKGILHVMDLMGLPENKVNEGFRLESLVREAYFVPRTKTIGDLMREFRQKHIHMAIVVDEYGGTSGIVTLEDILEEIVGEIHDEDEVETQKIKKVEEGVYQVDPSISISDLKEELGIDLHPEDEEIHIDTLGGFILYVHGRVPRKGDVVLHKDLAFEIVEMDGNKIERIKLKVNVLQTPTTRPARIPETV